MPGFVYVSVSATNGAASTNTTLVSPSAIIKAGTSVIAGIRTPSGGSVTSVTDPKGNTWVVDATSGSAASNITFLSCFVTTDLLTSDTITFNHTVTGSNKSVMLLNFTGLWKSTSGSKNQSNINSNAGSSLSVGTGFTPTLTANPVLVFTGVATGAGETNTFSVDSYVTKVASGLSVDNICVGYYYQGNTVAAAATWSWTATSTASGTGIVAYRLASPQNSLLGVG